MVYQYLAKHATKYIEPATLMKYGFNFSPMYVRTTGRVTNVSKDLMKVRVIIPISYRNRNYVGSIFGGSMLSATDPILMVQLINILNNFSNNNTIASASSANNNTTTTTKSTTDFVVWDKSVEMRFKRPAFEPIQIDFDWTLNEIEHIRDTVLQQGEMEYHKTIQLKNMKNEDEEEEASSAEESNSSSSSSSNNNIFAESTKTLYIATKEHYQQKMANRKKKQQNK